VAAEEALSKGAIVSVDEERVRIRLLPIDLALDSD
jgi:hypothetical protein